MRPDGWELRLCFLDSANVEIGLLNMKVITMPLKIDLSKLVCSVCVCV